MQNLIIPHPFTYRYGLIENKEWFNSKLHLSKNKLKTNVELHLSISDKKYIPLT